MRIIGIDPGTATVGWGVIEEEGSVPRIVGYGHISTDKSLPAEERLEEISRDIESLISTYKPDEAAIEELFFAKNVTTAMAVGQARGVILLTLHRLCIRISGYTPLEVKQAVTNYGRAEKRQVQEMVKNILKLKEIPKPDDAADALAIALCHSGRRRVERAYETGKLS